MSVDPELHQRVLHLVYVCSGLKDYELLKLCLFLWEQHDSYVLYMRLGVNTLSRIQQKYTPFSFIQIK